MFCTVCRLLTHCNHPQMWFISELINQKLRQHLLRDISLILVSYCAVLKRVSEQFFFTAWRISSYSQIHSSYKTCILNHFLHFKPCFYQNMVKLWKCEVKTSFARNLQKAALPFNKLKKVFCHILVKMVI